MDDDTLLREMTDDELATCTRYWDAGMHPGWRRVWRDGRDITDDDPATWPWPWRDTGRSSRARASRGRRG